jgi:hypothetical protein
MVRGDNDHRLLCETLKVAHLTTLGSIIHIRLQCVRKGIFCYIHEMGGSMSIYLWYSN